MMEEISVFYSCCVSLQTGNGLLEAQEWLNRLLQNEARCFELCITVISAMDPPVNALFLAAKLAYNGFKQNGQWATLNDNVQCDVIKVRR
jgi:hypothetical protein